MKILCVLSRYAYGRPERGENYDYTHFVPAFARLGHQVEVFDSGARAPYADFAALNAALVAKIEAFRPDVMFCVLMHYEIWMETLDLVRTRTPIRVINWGTDDSWKFMQASRFFARHVDWHVTTDGDAAERAAALGLDNVVTSQWAASEDRLSPPLPAAQCDFDVSFVGSLYGEREALIAALRADGVTVHCFGHGSEHGVVEAHEVSDIYRRSRISLNFSGAGDKSLFGASSRQIKARVFEVTGAGGFLLSEHADGLERLFQPGEDIAVFRTREELVERVRYYLAHPEARDRVARAGQRHTAERHTYARRFADILQKTQSRLRPADEAWQLDQGDLAEAAVLHRKGEALRMTGLALAAALSLVFGPERGHRAARRLVYELAWRRQGEAAFGAAGWPGRMFYRES